MDLDVYGVGLVDDVSPSDRSMDDSLDHPRLIMLTTMFYSTRLFQSRTRLPLLGSRSTEKRLELVVPLYDRTRHHLVPMVSPGLSRPDPDSD